MNEALVMRGELAESIEAAETFPALLRAIAAEFGDMVAVRLEEDGQPIASLSFAQLERESAQRAKGLIARGMGKGARVGFILGNNIEFVVTLVAIARIGAVAIPFSTLIGAEEMVRTLRQSDVAGLF